MYAYVHYVCLHACICVMVYAHLHGLHFVRVNASLNTAEKRSVTKKRYKKNTEITTPGMAQILSFTHLAQIYQ